MSPCRENLASLESSSRVDDAVVLCEGTAVIHKTGVRHEVIYAKRHPTVALKTSGCLQFAYDLAASAITFRKRSTPRLGCQLICRAT